MRQFETFLNILDLGQSGGDDVSSFKVLYFMVI